MSIVLLCLWFRPTHEAIIGQLTFLPLFALLHSLKRMRYILYTDNLSLSQSVINNTSLYLASYEFKSNPQWIIYINVQSCSGHYSLASSAK